MYVCELELPGRTGGCGAPADCGVGLIDPWTEKYVSVPLSCEACLRRLCDEAPTQFRRMEIPWALRMREVLHDKAAGLDAESWENVPARTVRVGDVTPEGTVDVWDPVLPGNRVLLTIDGTEYERDWNAMISVRANR